MANSFAEIKREDLPGDIKEILLIRSAPMEQFNIGFQDLKARFPGADITVLAQPQVKDKLEKGYQIHEVILYNEKNFGLLGGLKYLNKIRRRRFDLAVILYNTPGGTGCSNLEWFALLVKTRYRIGYGLDRCITKLSLGVYLLKVIFPLRFLLNLIIFLLIGGWTKSASILKKSKAGIVRQDKPASLKRSNKKKRFQIGIDARFLSYGIGIQKLGDNFIKNLPSVNNDFVYNIFQNTPEDLYSYPDFKKTVINIPLYSWQEQIFFPGRLLVNRIDLLHGLNYIVPVVKPCKSVVTICDLAFFHAHPYSKQYSQQKQIKRLRKWVLFSAKSADMIIAISESTKRDIIRFLHIPEDKIKVIYPGVDFRLYRVIENPKLIELTRDRYNLPSRYILSVSSASVRKNYMGIIKAYHRLKQEAISCKLVFTGREHFFSEEMFDVIRDSGLEDDIIFPGYVPESDLPVLYNGADLVVYPSFFEGFGLPVLEAMACGTPVITSNVSSLPEVAGNAAIMVDPYNVDELAEAMWRALSQDSLKKEMVAEGLKQTRRFSWEKMARETLGVYKELLKDAS